MSYGTVCPKCRKYVRDSDDYAYHKDCHVAVLAVAKEALEFYEKPRNHVKPYVDGDGNIFVESRVELDKGKIAREALAKIEEMEK